MKMNYKISLAIILGFLNLLGCSGIKYKSRADISKDPPEIRYEIINEILKKYDINTQDIKCTKYIDYIITKSKRYDVLEKIYSPNDYADFLKKSIPTLYYAYSLENYQKAGNPWKENVEKYLVESLPYVFSVGEKQFREHYLKSLKNKENNAMLFWDKGELDFDACDQTTQIAYLTIWLNELKWKDFLLLSSKEQSEIIFRMLLFRLKFVGGNKNATNSINALAVSWGENASRYLSLPDISSIDQNQKVGEVFMEDNRFLKIKIIN